MSSSAASVTITGMDELKTKLASLGADLQAELVKAGLKAMKLNVEAQAKEKARVHNDNGTLTASINTQEVSGSSETVIKTGTTLHYAKYVEFGTGIYAEGGDGRKTPWLWKVESRKWAAIFGIERGESVLWFGSHPYPFLRPAIDENKDQVMDDIRADLMKAVSRYSK